MRALYRAMTLCAALIAYPAIAQQGPAGVPGAPGLAPPPPPPVVVAAPEVPSKVIEPSSPVCGKNKSGKPDKSCRPKKKTKAANSCNAASDPGRCEQYRKTRELCKNVADYRQCLRDNLTTP